MTEKPTYEELNQRVSELLRADQTLREEHSFRTAVIKHAAEGLCVCHAIADYPYVCFTVWNDRMSEITGYTMEEINKRGWYQSVYPDQEIQTRAMERMARMRQGDDLQKEEWEITRADGQKRTIRISTSFLTTSSGVAHVLALMDDITEAQKAREEVRQAQKEWEEIFQAIGQPTLILDSEHNILKVNNSTIRETGSSEEELLEKKCFQVFHNSLFPPEGCPLEKLILSGRMETVEMEMEALGKSFLVSCTPLLDEQGQLKKIIHIAMDISEIKKAEKDLKESEEKFRVIFDGAFDGLLIADTESKMFLLGNQSICRMLGYSAEEIIRLSLKDIHPQEALPYVIEQFEKQIRKEIGIARDLPVRTKEGKIFYADISSAPIFLNGRTCLIGIFRDVSEQKRAEEALQKENEKFQRLVEGSPFGVALIDKQGHYLYVNPKFEEIFAYTLDDIPTGREWFRKAFPEETYREEVVSAWITDQKKVESGEYRQRTYKVRCKDDSVKWIHIRSVSLKDGTQLITYDDITERKQAEEALRKSEEKFSKAFKTSPDSININRLSDGMYLDINDGFTKNNGYTREDVIGRSSLPGDLGIWVHPEDRDRLVASLQATGEMIGLEAPFRCKDGKVMYGRMSARVLEIDGEPCILSITSDITERKQAEEALRKSEERYRTVLESIEEGYYEVDMAGNFTFFNDALCKMMGYSQDELAGINNRRYTDEENAKKLFKAFNEVYRTGLPIKDLEFQMIKKDGTKGIGEISVSAMRDEADTIIGFRGIVRSIVARKQAEEEKKKLERQFHQAQKMEAVGTLAGGIAHDFNNLLMGIQGRASLMLSDLDDSHSFYEQLKEIETYVKGATDLTKQLLGLARRGKFEVQLSDINKMVEQSAHLFGRTKKEISLHRKFQADLWTVDVDRRQIEQVLLNLFVNAWQAMPAGGDIYLETRNIFLEEEYVRPHGLKPGRYVRISVTDTGTGMDETIIQKIFDPFFTTKEMARGTGLGLSSAYGIIKNHQGIINVYSEKGHGSTFNIYLPASEKELQVEIEPSITIETGSETLLLVDDEEMILKVGQTMLERLGYQVLTAKGGVEALKLLGQTGLEIRLVILDMIMPGMSGEETFQQIKTGQPEIKVLLSSGYSLNGQAQDILKKGCDGFIQKPFSLSELSQKIKSILGSPNKNSNGDEKD